MSYTDDAALARLSALNDTQDSIATAAQWFLFHRKHAERTVQLWHQRLRDSPSSKRLTLMYLANEVAQQSKVRRKDDFVLALAPVIADATAAAYKGASNEVQQRVVRVVDVWRQRAVFPEHTINGIDARLQEVDKARGNTMGFATRGSQPSPPMPTELVPLADALLMVAKSVVPSRSSIQESRENYDKVTDPNAETPAPPVHAARLNGLLRNLSTAEAAIQNSIKARKSLVDNIESILESARRDLASEQKNLDEVQTRKTEVDAKKQEVEVDIMRNLAANDKPKSPDEPPEPAKLMPPELDRPAVEALTPPPGTESGPFKPPVPEPVQSPQTVKEPQAPEAPGIELLSNVASQYQSVPVHTNGSNKRRKVESGDDEFPDLGADDGIDADVAEMLRKES
ncbi:UPF0400 protein [Zalerion maritima]|uniref:UPF0400 protein n=1 Tax=Zalerion maritima TaxID=339359 RepID=A0AAD5RJ46_9PEZI|nr:UPF0400 protein [Zalerion maritima]